MLALVVCLYWFVVRPWRREHRVTTDGMLLIAFFDLSFLDPLSGYFNNWRPGQARAGLVS